MYHFKHSKLFDRWLIFFDKLLLLNSIEFPLDLGKETSNKAYMSETGERDKRGWVGGGEWGREQFQFGLSKVQLWAKKV